ncbi:siderophore iron transporter [Truncatella angustata]|uniref:Siderophore iron transporter n=1 Tax=Truncatella angustata TaxID=152316 RepID=A0A9P8UAE9_9PEZI|nr:siderophore iron transporter [Truncatella angustata]KAH6647224.1 siderophore iron transporter [Truncatella angustata]
MVEYVQLGRVAPPTSADAVSPQDGTADVDMLATTDSRVPLLSSSDASSAEGSFRNSDEYDDDLPGHSSDGTAGVQQADAINLVWSRNALILAYFFIFLCSFAQALQWQILSNLTPYVTSEFHSHSLIPTIEIVSSILSGVLKLPISKIIDAWGRPQGLAAMIVLATLGLILMAVCQSVETYAAAQVFYAVGISGFSYVLNIIVADTSSLKNRTLAFAFQNTPSLVTTVIGPPIARAFYEKSSWRWGFALSSILFFILSIPILVLLLMNARKAVKAGLLKKETNEEKWSLQNIRHNLWEYDALGLALVTFGLTFAFVPVSLGVGVGAGGAWKLALLIVGILLLVAFAVHEKLYARRPVISARLLFSRNVAGSCLLSIFIFVAYFAWDSYYSSYLQVVHGLTITEAGYINHIYGFGSTIWAVVVGYLLKVSDRYKWLAWVALPIHIAGGVSLILFRRPDTHISLLVLAQILLTVGGSTLVMCDQMAVMAVASHEELASVMAVLSLAYYVGSAGGNALSGSIWNSVLPTTLAKLLPNFSSSELKILCSDLKQQLSYPMGSPTRDAIITAYSTAQVKMCITGAAISLLQIIAVAMWRDAKLSTVKQVKGKVV